MKNATRKKNTKRKPKAGYIVIEMGQCKTAYGYKRGSKQTDFFKGPLLARRQQALLYCFDRLAGQIKKDETEWPIVDEDEYQIHCLLWTRKETVLIFWNKVLLDPALFLQPVGGLLTETEFLIDLLN